MQHNQQPDYPEYSVYLDQLKLQPNKQNQRHDVSSGCELLSLPEYVYPASLSQQARDLRVSLDHVAVQAEKSRQAALIAQLFQHSILLFIACGNMKYAREICYSLIQGFIKWSNRIGNFHLLKYVFQAWINLIKIDRLDGNFYDAFNKLNILQPVNCLVQTRGENNLLMALLYDALNQDAEIKQAVMKQCFIERIRLCLITSQFAELHRLTEARLENTAWVHAPFCKEARVISLTRMGRTDEALHLLIYSKKFNYDLTVQRIFQLRKCEIYLYCDRTIPSADFAFLQHLVMNSISKRGVQAVDIIIAINAARIMHASGMIEDAIRLANFCLDASTQLVDDVLKADSLSLLHGIDNDSGSRRVIEDLMVMHYYETQFYLARQKLLSSFPDLKYVEHSHKKDEFTPLFEDLLSFSSSNM
jgi:hypothetical protein